MRDFQFFFGVSEVNAFLLWRRYRCNNSTMEHFRRSLTYQMIYNPWRDRRNSRGRGITGGELEQLNHYLIYLPSYISASNSGKRRCRACGALTAWCCACSPPPLALNSSSGKGRYASGLPLCNKGECMGFAKHCAGLPLKDTKRMRVTDDLEQT